MKLLKNLLACAAAAGLLASQAAVAAPAARIASPAEGEGLFGDGTAAPVIAAISIFVLFGLGMLIFDDNDDEEPVSP